MYYSFVVGKASDYQPAKSLDDGYAGFFTLTYRGFNRDNKTEKTFIILVKESQVKFAKQQADKGYTLGVRAHGMRAWVDKSGDVRLALEFVDLIIP